MHPRPALLALVASTLFPAPAHAAWDPVEPVVRDAPFGLSLNAAADAAGRQLVVLRAGRAGEPLRVLTREDDRAPFAAAPLAGSSARSVQPRAALARGGQGLVTWRQDSPRAYAAIRASLQDPDTGALTPPVTLAGESAGGVRHPAPAIDEDGWAVVAFTARTRDTHLSQRGRIAIAVRAPGRPFTLARVVTPTPAHAPEVAIVDGRAVVAWVRGTRVEAVAVDRGRIGRVRELARAPGVADVGVAVDPDGRAAVVWREGNGPSAIRMATRDRTGGFRAARTLRSSRTRLLRLPAVAAGAGGRVVAAWSEEDYTGTRPRKPGGFNGIYARVRVALGSAQTGRFERAVAVSSTQGFASAPALTAGRERGTFALAWSHRVDDAASGVQGLWIGPRGPGAVHRIGPPLSHDWEVQRPPAAITARRGATVLWAADEGRSLLLADGGAGT
jgi:hypothetical protein